MSQYTEAMSMHKIASKTKKDPILSKLATAIRSEKTPKPDHDLDPSELTLSDSGFILKGEKVILPSSLWKIAIENTHQGGHPGMSCPKRRIRTHFWFPKVDAIIEDKVRHCPSCQIFTR